MTLASRIADPAWHSPPVRNSTRKPANLLLNMGYVNGAPAEGCGQHIAATPRGGKVEPFWLYLARLVAVECGCSKAHDQSETSLSQLDAQRSHFSIGFDIRGAKWLDGGKVGSHGFSYGLFVASACAHHRVCCGFGRFSLRRKFDRAIPEALGPNISRCVKCRPDRVALEKRECNHQHLIPLTSRVAGAAYTMAAHHA